MTPAATSDMQCENVEMVPPSSIKFDFLGKDSIRYENTVEVHPKVGVLRGESQEGGLAGE